MIDMFDRPGKASAEVAYAGTNMYADGFKNGKHILKIGATASAGLGHAQLNGAFFTLRPKGPLPAVVSRGIASAEAFAILELGSASKLTPVSVLVTFVTQDNFARGANGDICHWELEDESGGTLSAGLVHVRVKNGNVGAEVKGPNIGTGAVSSAKGDAVFVNGEVASYSVTAGKVKAEAKLPSASAAAMCSEKGNGVLDKAELVSVSASAGPVKAKLGLSLDHI
ncbi:hypothetical protein JOQ06_011684 [Pogonophryne albipinna]|uniref:Uncharacterized protein n=1 Tax=Pogonophryne albipinna TaxID=1090488 RepID=A0AAD6FNF7_9TELE|nr:hypothetical protein JOQ06_011684 [Pogonophryne albipinna]